MVYLTEDILKQTTKTKTGEIKLLGLAAVKLHVAAIINLYQQQVNANANNHNHPRSELVNGLIQSVAAREHAVNTSAHVDRQRNTLADGISTSREIQKVCDLFMSKNSSLGIRDRMAMALTTFNILRGESARALELPDLFTLELEREGPIVCHALVMIMRQGKMNPFGKLEYGATMRNQNVNICPHGTLALSLFDRFHVQQEPFPDFNAREKWYNIKASRLIFSFRLCII